MRIEFASGEYVLDEPLTLTPADSGQESSPVVYAAARDARVIFTGGRRINGWRAAQLNGRDVWAADVPEARPDVPAATRWQFRELFVGGERRTLARHPNSGFLQLQDVPDVPAGTPWNQGQNWFRFREEDREAWSIVTPGVEVVTFMRWVDDHRVIASVDPDQRIAKTTRPAIFLNDPGDFYILENAGAFLDEPGEWWLDDQQGVLYYSPKPGDSMDGLVAIAPRLDALLNVEGEPEQGRLVHDVQFTGITFAHARWWFPNDFALQGVPPGVHGFQQAAWGVPAAVRLAGASRIVLDHCTIEHVAGYGIDIGRACNACELHHCTITDLGAGGVKIGLTNICEQDAAKTRDNIVEDCVISDGGRIHHQAIGVWIGQSSGNRLAHNRITGFDYSGISIGWTWGYGPSDAADRRDVPGQHGVGLTRPAAATRAW